MDIFKIEKKNSIHYLYIYIKYFMYLIIKYRKNKNIILIIFF